MLEILLNNNNCYIIVKKINFILYLQSGNEQFIGSRLWGI